MSPRPNRGHDIKPLQLRLPEPLIRQIKHQAIEESTTVSVLAEKALLHYLLQKGVIPGTLPNDNVGQGPATETDRGTA